MTQSKILRRYAYGLFSLAALVFCACTQVPDYCGDGSNSFDTKNQLCRDGTAYSKCGREWYDPRIESCVGGVVVPNTPGGTTPVIDVDNNCGVNGTADSCKTVVIGGKRWMAENLNKTTAESWRYGEGGKAYVIEGDTSRYLSGAEVQGYCKKYGRLYTWAAAKSACRSVGWRLPDTAEWNRMVEVADGIKAASSDYWDYAGKALKADHGWWNGGNGSDTYGFSALPGGYRGIDGSFYYVGSYGYWWTASENGGYAYGRNMFYNYVVVLEHDYDKGDGFSVRCVADE